MVSCPESMNEMYLENQRKTGAECLHAQTRCEEIKTNAR